MYEYIQQLDFIKYKSSAVSSNFLGVVRRKTVMQLGNLGGVISPPQWGEAPENFGSFAF